MTLTLEVTASSAEMPVKPRHVFSEDGGSIGRGTGTSWPLTHNEVSKQHALITCRDGVFYIQDTSRNGIAVNSPENRLVRNRPYPLKTGDRLYIDPYIIEVWIDPGPQASARPSRLDPFGDDSPFPVPGDPSDRPHLVSEPGSPVHDDVDPLKFLDPGPRRAPRKADPVVPPADELLNAHYEPPSPAPVSKPKVDPDSGIIPVDYNPLKSEEPVVRPAPPVRPRPEEKPQRPKFDDSEEATVREFLPLPERAAPAPIETPLSSRSRQSAAGPAPRPAGASADLSELLAGAGVPDAAVTPELSRNLGEILRVVVEGLMDILKSRQQIKEEFRMQQTMFRPIDNNPLKFSVNVEDALHNLLVKRNAAYLGPVDAFADAFDDLRDHQLAMLAGMRVAFEAMLADFDADTLQEEFDVQIGKLAVPLVPAKMRYWEMYRERRQAMAKDPEATFARLFGEEFRRAYEEQFRKLKAARRGRKTQRSDG